MDVHNAFLYGDLEKKVYISIPSSFHVIEHSKTCRLQKSLYSLCQASKNWSAKFTSVWYEYRYVQLRANNSLFIYSKETTFITILVYVIDLILACNNLSQC